MSLTNFRLIDRNQDDEHSYSPSGDESGHEKHSDGHRSGLKRSAKNADGGSQIHGFLSTSRLAHPSYGEGSKCRTGTVEAIDGTCDGVGMGRIAAKVEILKKAWLSKGV